MPRTLIQNDDPSAPSPDFDPKFERAFALLAFAANRFILNHMRRIHTELSVDLETAMVWGTLAHLNILADFPMNADPMSYLNSQGLRENLQMKPQRLTDLSQVTGLPRETVRRKLERLSQLGKVCRTEDGRWVYNREAVTAVDRAFSRETVINLINAAGTIEKLLDGVDLDKSKGKSTNHHDS